MSREPGRPHPAADGFPAGVLDGEGWRRIRTTVVIGSLRGGGAERVVTTLANAWAVRGDAVTIVTLDRETPFYPLEKSVTHWPLGVAGVSGDAAASLVNVFRRTASLRAAIRRSEPVRIISFIETANLLALLATRGLGIPVIVSERTDPAHFPTTWTVRVLRRVLYPFADAVIVQTVDAGRFFTRWVLRRLQVIPNPVLPAPEGAGPASVPDKRIVALGRLSREKGFDLLIEGFARVAPGWPEWSLEIWGEGAERPELEVLVKARGLQDRVRLPGQTASPEAVLRGAGLFVLPSRMEGFPNAMCEAMAAGVTVLAADCPSGPRNIIRDGVDGLLVRAGDSSALAEGMDRLLGDETLRGRLARRAPEIVKRYALEDVLGLWDRVLTEVSSSRRSSG